VARFRRERGGIAVKSVALFGNTNAAGGGITNTGTIVAALTGILASFDTSFLGGIANKGTISAGAPSQAAIYVFEVSSFSGGIVNSTGGVISAVNAGIGASGDSVFSGGIAHKGAISAHRGVAIDVVGVTTFSGGIINQGKVNARLGSGLVSSA
jgi:hypothetical protein